MEAKPTESFEDVLEKIAGDYGQLHEEQCDLNAEDGSVDGCDCAMSGLVSEVFAAHQAAVDQRVAEARINAERDMLEAQKNEARRACIYLEKNPHMSATYLIDRYEELNKAIATLTKGDNNE